MKKWQYWLIFILLIGAIFFATIAILKTYNIDRIKTPIVLDRNNQAGKIETFSTTTTDSITPLNTHEVIRIIDGDTIVIKHEGREEKVRMIGVNTPESVDPRRKVECFGKEASDYTKKLLSGKRIRIEFDETQNPRDKYDRLLLYIYLDGTLINKEIIRSGYGHEYTCIHPYKYRDDFKKAQDYAKENKLGLWADNACLVK